MNRAPKPSDAATSSMFCAAEELPAVKAFLEAEDKPLQICMLLGHPAVSYRRTAPRRAGDFVMK